MESFARQNNGSVAEKLGFGQITRRISGAARRLHARLLNFQFRRELRCKLWLDEAVVGCSVAKALLCDTLKQLC